VSIEHIERLAESKTKMRAYMHACTPAVTDETLALFMPTTLSLSAQSGAYAPAHNSPYLEGKNKRVQFFKDSRMHTCL
jgi:hypothetical protein